MIRFRFAPIFLALALGLALPLTGFAGHRGDISFTPAERADHELGQDAILSTAAACLRGDLEHHRAFFKRYGISPYYGDRSKFGKLSYAEKKNYLRAMGIDVKLLPQLEPTSCVGITMSCLGAGFKAAGQNAYWQRIRAFVLLNGVDGTALQAGLQQLGWKILYWNPDVRMNREWDRTERAKNPSNSDRLWGYHEENWKNVRNHNRYLFNSIDDSRLLVNFGAQTPNVLRDIPFFVGTAHMGYHVFPGTFGEVVEAHSTRAINDFKTMQSAEFNPLAGKAPTDGMYHSGLIAVPAKFVR